jgi:hypothetical protein
VTGADAQVVLPGDVIARQDELRQSGRSRPRSCGYGSDSCRFRANRLPKVTMKQDRVCCQRIALITCSSVT